MDDDETLHGMFAVIISIYISSLKLTNDNDADVRPSVKLKIPRSPSLGDY